MPRSSKLARKMALKKKIEEEFRLAEERGKVEKVSLYDNYWDRPDVIVLKKQDKIREEDTYSPKTIQKNIKSECLEKEEPIKDDLEDKIPEKENKVEENIFLENSIILEDKMTTTYIENTEKKRKRKKKKKNRKAIEEFESKEVEQLQEDETLRLARLFEKEKTEQILEEKRNEEFEKTTEKIKELEQSIACLDNDLERFDIERMKEKNKEGGKKNEHRFFFQHISCLRIFIVA